MSQGSIEPVESLRRLVNGYQITQAIGVMVTLGLPDELASGPRSPAELATATATNPGALARLLRALVAVGLLREPAEQPGAVELTEVGQLLRSDAPESFAGWAAYVVRPHHWEAWGDLLSAVRTGASTFSVRHDGQTVWAWRQERPEENEIFNRAMHALSSATARRLATTYDFSGFSRIADLGGGDGTLLAAVLVRHPDLRGVVFDLPHVVAEAPARLQAAGVADRVEVVGGSFFDGVPTGCDAYVLKSVLHDWDDESSVRILRCVREVATPASAVLIVERTLGEQAPGPVAAMSDLNMLTMTGGAERTLSEWSAITAAAGFAITGTVDIGAEWSVIEARARRGSMTVTDEAKLLVRYLDAQRNHVLGALEGLTDEQLRRPVLPSGWCCLGLVKHLALADEHYWFRSVVGGEPFDFFPEGPNADWIIEPTESAEDILGLYRAEIDRANAVIAETPLDAPPRQPDPAWATWGIDFPDLRRILLHVITETACHAGHLDATRELLDGRQWIVM